jgi:hypothetical protein
MAHTDDAPGDHPVVAVGHETTDADLGSTERIIVVMVVGLGIAAAIVWGMFSYLRTQAALNDLRPLPIASGRQGDRVPPLPRLQTRPAADLQTFRAAEDAALEGYQWVDRQHGIARIPVSRAIDIVAEKGLPHRAAGATEQGGPAPQGAPTATGAGAAAEKRGGTEAPKPRRK